MNRLLLVRIVRLVFAILILLLMVRLILVGVGANPDSQVVGLLLAISEPLVLPFRFLFKPLPPLGFVGIDGAALLALLVILLLAWLTFKLLKTE
jgi:uncharacterized protein YggT (Ycf19 family)